jgi:membrane-bound ClpP family serine protease
VVGAVGLGAVVTVTTYPAVGPASLSLGVTAFFVAALIFSGYRRGRAIVWGIVVAGLFAFGWLGPSSIGRLLIIAGALLFFAGVLSPTFRRWWFGQRIE